MSQAQQRQLKVRRAKRLLRTRRRDRRGVLLMVVLSMLALFLLLGTAFLVSSQFYAKSARSAAKENRTENNPYDLMERAMMQVLRDTNNPSSAIRFHSLLRDMYGTDGFVAEVYPDNTIYPCEYSGNAQFGSPYAVGLGPTNGQFIDLYVRDLPVTSMLPLPENVIKLDRHPNGTTIDHSLSAATGYYNGCLLTMLDGAAAGQTTRILDYRYMGLDGAGAPVFRLRVMAFGRADGGELTPDDLAGMQRARFMVNGRPHNGTGAGYNRFAKRGQPRLSTVEVLLDQGGSGTPIDALELALTPNGRYMDPFWYADSNIGDTVSSLGSILNGTYQPFGYRAAGDQVLYTSFDGPGGSDESYDAVDYQNMFLAHMPLSPLSQAGVLVNSTTGGGPMRVDLAAFDSQNNSNPPSGGMRLDMENTIIPSFHRPALLNYWNHRLLNASWMQSIDVGRRAELISMPYGVDAATRPSDAAEAAAADMIVGVKRRVSLRPLREDHPNFDGTNPSTSFVGTIPGTDNFFGWDVVGPWDVDNDNDGINDSIWVDLGDPVQETENGTLFKAMYAFLVVDLDNRLNVNAHGSPDHLAATNCDPLMNVTGNLGNMAGGDQSRLGNTPIVWTSNIMPVGMGWGPGDVSLRSILSPLTQAYTGGYPFASIGNPAMDDYARLLFGRLPADPNSDAIWGRLGTTVGLGVNSRPGMVLDSTNLSTVAATREPMVPYDFFQYPMADRMRSERLGVTLFSQPSSFATSPDLRGRYSTGLDYLGQPVYEPAWDLVNPASMTSGQALVPLLDDSPYEIDLASNARRGLPGAVTPQDDALFATSELERILRAYDPETGTAPSRLYEIVDAFDPNKYALTVASNSANITPEELALAQLATAENRRQVTTDSYEVPVPAEVVPSYITELGPDGAPGIAGVDDDGNGATDDPTPFNVRTNVGEIGWYQVQDPAQPSVGLYFTAWSDDFASYTGKSVADARLVDVLWYRIQRDRERRGLPIYNWNNVQAVSILDNIAKQLLPPEVLAGYKMDVNRPFGDGVDNNGNGIVDEPLEAGEPFNDSNQNGVWDNGEQFVDLDGNGLYSPPVDNLWAAQLGVGVRLDSTMSQDVAQAPFTDVNGNGRRDLVAAELQVDVDGDGSPDVNVPPTVRNDAHLARQLYARHLYMLMLILMDEDYVMPYDPSDPSVRAYLRVKAIQLKSSSINGMTDAQAKLEAQRRYTYRQIAQWAVNCVDFRDSDAINTPFEFDENPWDGWGTINDNGTPDDPTDDTYFPLDGDATTNENFQQVIDWENMSNDGIKIVTNPIPTYGPGSNQQRDELATHNIVWGAERPELLISETAAFHDLRLEDLATSESKGDNTTTDNDQNRPQDDDLDQRLEPRGSLYVEVYNPNSPDTPKPVELYRYGFTQHPAESNADFIKTFNKDPNDPNNVDVNDTYHWYDSDGDGNVDTRLEMDGVLLDRLSNVGRLERANGKVQRSPVWRLIVVEEHPGYHDFTGQDKAYVTRDDNKSSAGNLQTGSPNRPESVADYWQAMRAAGTERDQIPYLAPMNMDWEEMFFIPPLLKGGFTPGQATVRWPMSCWQQERTSEENVNANNPENQQASFERQLFAKPYPYIEREFYFTSNDTPYFGQNRKPGGGNPTKMVGTARTYHDIDKGQLKDFYLDMGVRIPFNSIELGNQLVSLPFRFVSTELKTGRPDMPIAPVMPGRYAVIGSAGTAYTGLRQVDPDNGDDRWRFVTTLGRNVMGGAGTPKARTEDLQHKNALPGTRRFEMHPSTNPYLQQWVVGANGGVFPNGTAITRRSNELMYVAANNDPTNPAPPENMTGEPSGKLLASTSNIAAPAVVVPVDDMNISEPAYGYGVRTRELFELEVNSGDEGQQWSPQAAEGEGAFVNAAGEEAHFDTPFDVDPEFTAAVDSPKTYKKYRVVHLQRLADPTMPWNPPPGYNEIDQQRAEYGRHDASLPVNPYLTVDSASVDLTIFNGTCSVNIQTSANRMFGSSERMHESQRSAQEAGGSFAVQQRAIFDQDFFMAPEQLLPNESTTATSTQRRNMPESVEKEHRIRENHNDYFFKHSLGLPNEAMGEFYIRPEANLAPAVTDPTDLAGNDGNQQTMGTALGAPRPDTTTGVASTYPWLNWTNRPFVSESELLQVPAWGTMELLRKFSVMNPIVQSDPYTNEGARNASNTRVRAADIEADFADDGMQSLTVDAEKTNAARYKSHVAGFGALLNMMQTSRYPARILQDTNGNPVPVGAPNFHRILDYVHTPSRFVATDTLLTPTTFNLANVNSEDDPRVGYLAPFNRVPNYREPGKVNLNTVVSQREAGSSAYLLWSDVFDGLMHRVQDLDPSQKTAGLPFGHFGPAWRDVVLSRRGYADPIYTRGVSPGGVDRADLVLDGSVPTFFSNPFRSGEAGDLVPLSALVRKGAEASMFRSHPFQPGQDFVWGGNGSDNGSALTNDSREAGINGLDGNPFVKVTAGGRTSDQASVPLFSELCSTTAIDATRNSAMHYGPLTRIDNMTTNRSGVFAIWVTVGYFEVTAAPNWEDDENSVRTKFMNQAGRDADRARALYNKVYPQGYQLGKELGSEIGNVDRHRAFYIVDRTRPVAFKPGDDVNVEDAILLRRRIE